MKKAIYKLFGTSVQGTSHVASGTECQDYCSHDTVTVDGITYAIASIADGVGSYSFSAKGARIAVESSIAFLKKHIEEATRKSNKIALGVEAIDNAFKYAQAEVERAAEEDNRIVLSYSSTLVVAVYDGSDLYYGNSGDSGMVVLHSNGEFELATERMKGETANSVVPLQSGIWNVGVSKNVAACFMMTDGVLDVTAPATTEGPLVYWPFFAYLLSGVDRNSKQEELDKFINDVARGSNITEKVSDDITILVVLNTENKYSEPKFSEEEYSRKVAVLRAKSNNALYKDDACCANQATASAGNSDADQKLGSSKMERRANWQPGKRNSVGSRNQGYSGSQQGRSVQRDSSEQAVSYGQPNSTGQTNSCSQPNNSGQTYNYGRSSASSRTYGSDNPNNSNKTYNYGKSNTTKQTDGKAKPNGNSASTAESPGHHKQSQKSKPNNRSNGSSKTNAKNVRIHFKKHFRQRNLDKDAMVNVRVTVCVVGVLLVLLLSNLVVQHMSGFSGEGVFTVIAASVKRLLYFLSTLLLGFVTSLASPSIVDKLVDVECANKKKLKKVFIILSSCCACILSVITCILMGMLFSQIATSTIIIITLLLLVFMVLIMIL